MEAMIFDKILCLWHTDMGREPRGQAPPDLPSTPDSHPSRGEMGGPKPVRPGAPAPPLPHAPPLFPPKSKPAQPRTKPSPSDLRILAFQNIGTVAPSSAPPR